MEVILQALTYPEIGTMVFRDAQWSTDPAVPIGDINYMVERGVTFIIEYPAGAWRSVTPSRPPRRWASRMSPIRRVGSVSPARMGHSPPAPTTSPSLARGCVHWVGFAQVINDGVGEGQIGVLGGTPGNALSLGWQQCHIPAFNRSGMKKWSIRRRTRTRRPVTRIGPTTSHATS